MEKRYAFDGARVGRANLIKFDKEEAIARGESFPPSMVEISEETFTALVEVPPEQRLWNDGNPRVATSAEAAAIQEVEIEKVHQQKPAAQKKLETDYVKFLRGELTDVLRALDIIADDVTITPKNTSRKQLLTYFLDLRVVDDAAFHQVALNLLFFTAFIEWEGGSIENAKEFTDDENAQ